MRQWGYLERCGWQHSVDHITTNSTHPHPVTISSLIVNVSFSFRAVCNWSATYLC